MEKTEHEKLDQLFQQLQKGETPDFLQMMLAISDISTIYPEPEPVCKGDRCLTCG